MTTPFRFEGVSLPVSDVAASVAFYQALGFVVEQQMTCLRCCVLAPAQSATSGEARRLVAALRKSVHIELTMDDLD